MAETCCGCSLVCLCSSEVVVGEMILMTKHRRELISTITVSNLLFVTAILQRLMLTAVVLVFLAG